MPRKSAQNRRLYAYFAARPAFLASAGRRFTQETANIVT
jgi:hypothetical protein